jgi:shikimate dehydrogenase
MKIDSPSETLSTPVDQYAVCGNPVSHSRSPQIHAAFAESTGQAMHYDRLFIPEGGFVGTVEHFFREGGKGLNVTLPCKGDAFVWLGEARCARSSIEASAVNTIRWDGKGFRGFNTDGVGLVRDLSFHGITIAGRRVLVLGAGGAVRGVLPELLAAKPAAITVANRTRERAEALVNAFRQRYSIPLETVVLSNATPHYDLIINGTSAALTSDARPDIDPAIVRRADCYDMVYGVNARFHLWARDITQGKSVDGLGMLIEQAAEAFWIWRGVRPATLPVRHLLSQS